MIEPTSEQPSDDQPRRLEIRVERLGVVLEPDGDPTEAGGVLNPAATRTRENELLLYPRCVEEGNISRVGIVHARPSGAAFQTQRDGFALEPSAPYELREHPGYGCEVPRVTYIGVIDTYVMAYTAFGPDGPRVALAVSDDARRWRRLGLVHFDALGGSAGDDKDAAFFPEPVLSPKGVRCLALYHRPMLHLSAVHGRAALPFIQRTPHRDRESIRIAYVALDAVQAGLEGLLDVIESVQVISPEPNWGAIKVGAGTPPVRIEEGWLSFFHGVDVTQRRRGAPSLRYSAGIVIHDAQRPDRLVYRSPEPLLVPQTQRERRGIVDNVVFPSGIDRRTDLGERVFDVFYGMGDYSIGAFRLWLGKPAA